MRRVGVEAEPLRAAPDHPPVEVGDLEQHVGRRLRDLGVEPAHDPGDPDGALAIGDDQDLGIELALLAVEGDQRLARPRPADPQLAPGNRRQVVGVQRLASYNFV